MIREISLDTEFLEAGRHPITRAGQIAPASIALVDVFERNAFYGVVADYDQDYVDNLLLNPAWSTLPHENQDLAKRLLEFQSQHIVPKLRLQGIPSNTVSKIHLNGTLYTLDYRIGTAPELGNRLIRYLNRTKGEETAIRNWAKQGASDQVVSRMFFDGLLPFKERLKSIGLTLQEGEIQTLRKPGTSFKKPTHDQSHNCLYDAAVDAENIANALA